MAMLQTAAANTARIDLNPADDTLRGLLIEEQRTNKCQNFNFNPDAGLTNISASAGTLDRVNDAANLPWDGGTVGGNVFHLNNTTGAAVTITVVGTTANTNKHSFRVFARFTGTAPTLQLTGAVGAVACNNAYAETKSNNVTPGATTNQWQLVVPNATEVWFLGNQLEEGAFVTSPIETLGAAATRAGDNVTSAIVGGLPAQWSVVFDGITAPGAGDQRMLALGDGTNSNRLALFRLPSRNINILCSVAGATTITAALFTNFPDLSPIKLALAANGSTVKVTINGGAVQTLTGAVASSTFTTRYIGRYESGNSFQWGGWIKNLREFPYALSDAQLIAESTL